MDIIREVDRQMKHGKPNLGLVSLDLVQQGLDTHNPEMTGNGLKLAKAVVADAEAKRRRHRIHDLTAAAAFLAVLFVAILLMAGCAPAPEPVDPYAAAHATCWVTQDQISEHHQPENAEAWHDTNDELCTAIAKELGRAEFIQLFTDEAELGRYIEEQL